MDLSQHQYYTFKEYRLTGDVHDMVGMTFLHPILQIMHAQIILYCYINNLPYDITRTLGKGIPGVSVSKTHAQGRAFDFSVRGWKQEDIDKLVADFNERFSLFGAISYSDKKPRLMVYHNGTGWHIHVQIRSDIPKMTANQLQDLLRRAQWIGNKNSSKSLKKKDSVLEKIWQRPLLRFLSECCQKFSLTRPTNTMTY